MDLIAVLIKLAKRGAVNRPVLVKTTSIAKELGISQQSVSRWLIDMEKKGLITRREGIRGYLVQITTEGKNLLNHTRKDLDEALEASRRLVINGKVVTGMGEGEYYTGLSDYTERLKSGLGFRPYPGTLNIRLGAMEDSQSKEKLCAKKGLEIPGFKKGGRTFGSIKCFPCSVSGFPGAVIIPERSHYGFDMLEIVSPHNLREKLRLSDGRDVKIEVLLNENI
jgi:riboflavin kinase